MDHTVFKMVLRDYVEQMQRQATSLADALLSRAIAERDTLIVAYTHGQPAQPTTYGHYLAAVLELLLRDLQRLQQASNLLNLCPMGAAAITTSGFPVDRQCMASLLGFEQPQLNSYGCIASVDYITGLYSAVKLVFLHLGRVIQDMQFWTAFETGQLQVPDSLVQISSIMPQKRNPVPIEHLRHLSSITCGRCDAIINTMHNTPFTDMNDSEGEVQTAGYAVFESAGRVLELFTTLIEACSINTDRVAAISDAACITVTELADTLVRREGLSFRQAHEIAAHTAQAVIDAKQPLGSGYVAFQQAFSQRIDRSVLLSEDDFRNAVSARAFVDVRNRPGGPAPQAMDTAFAEYRNSLLEKRQALDSQNTRIASAATSLAEAFGQLAGG
jgi:argininosuccinate lyase